ncbi:hypothetical protein Pla110_16040 [Polystyrenella longa]|uniref:Uncharacterized protein n=1 Tax=Polystyrenella longa TaxID=2528007 RepID=A0A518CL27_9PLAN|nr:hypothetical protein Pla110_16040 [Polystyrenella longa]
MFLKVYRISCDQDKPQFRRFRDRPKFRVKAISNQNLHFVRNQYDDRHLASLCNTILFSKLTVFKR